MSVLMSAVCMIALVDDEPPAVLVKVVLMAWVMKWLMVWMVGWGGDSSCQASTGPLNDASY